MANPFADRFSTYRLGRFSSTMLQQAGAQRSVKALGGADTTVYRFRRGDENFPTPDGLVLDDKDVATGSVPENTFNVLTAYFQGRGAPRSNAATMAALVIDTGKLENSSPIFMVENVFSTNTFIDPVTYVSLNVLRSVGDQQEIVSTINNRKSLKSRSIKA